MDAAARAELATRHLDLPRQVALVIHPRVRTHIELEELIALGNLGLAEAIQRFDPTSGANFRTFAWYRVQGTMLDAIRRLSNLPRRVWTQMTALAASAEYLEAAAGRAAAAQDRSGAANATEQLRAVRDALGAIRTMYVVAIDAVPAGAMPSASGDDPRAALARSRRAARLQAAIATLPERERALVQAHYGEGQTLAEAGAAMGLSKSWTSRLHARAIERLRDELAGSRDGADDG